jgi:hypothetical protein
MGCCAHVCCMLYACFLLPQEEVRVEKLKVLTGCLTLQGTYTRLAKLSANAAAADSAALSLRGDVAQISGPRRPRQRTPFLASLRSVAAPFLRKLVCAAPFIDKPSQAGKTNDLKAVQASFTHFHNHLLQGVS